MVKKTKALVGGGDEEDAALQSKKDAALQRREDAALQRKKDAERRRELLEIKEQRLQQMSLEEKEKQKTTLPPGEAFRNKVEDFLVLWPLNLTQTEIIEYFNKFAEFGKNDPCGEGVMKMWRKNQPCEKSKAYIYAILSFIAEYEANRDYVDNYDDSHAFIANQKRFKVFMDTFKTKQDLHALLITGNPSYNAGGGAAAAAADGAAAAAADGGDDSNNWNKYIQAEAKLRFKQLETKLEKNNRILLYPVSNGGKKTRKRRKNRRKTKRVKKYYK